MSTNVINFTVPCFRELKKITKRFVLIFNIWDDKKYHTDYTEFDTEEEYKHETKLINEIYGITPRPQKVSKEENYRRRYGNKEYIVSFVGGAKYWGYIVIDFEKNEIIKIGNDGLKEYGKKISLAMKDYYLRKPGEIPEDYKFECRPEYDGWLQYRWGNRKNAVDYVEPPKPKRENIQPIISENELEDYELDEDYEAELIENKFADLLDKETRNRLMEKYGW